MIDCQGLSASDVLGRRRQERAFEVFGEEPVKRVIGLGLFFLGVERSAIADRLSMPVESFKTFVKNVHREGLAAIEDRRRRQSGFLPRSAAAQPIVPAPVRVIAEEQQVLVDLGVEGRRLIVPSRNRIELRAILLALKRSGLLSAREAADVLGVSEQRVGQLASKLDQEDVPGLIDKRQGQLRDHAIDDNVKQELALQCAANSLTGRSTSSEALARDIEERCKIRVSPRSIRHHAGKLGLAKLAGALPALIEALKGGSSSH